MHYTAAAHPQAAALHAEIGRLGKAAEERVPGGAFEWSDAETRRTGHRPALFLHPAQHLRQDAGRVVGELYDFGGQPHRCHGVVRRRGKPGEEVTLDAQEMKTPTMDVREAERRIAEAEGKLRTLDAEFSRVAASEELLAEHACSLKERLQGVRVTATAQEAADGTLVVMEGWAEKETSGQGRCPFGGVPQCGLLQSGPHARGRERL